MKNKPYLALVQSNKCLLAGSVMVLNMTLNTVQAAAQLQSIEVIFNNQTAMIKDTQATALENQGVTVAWYNLDLPAQLSQALSQGLPANPELAKSIVQERLHSQGSRALNQRYQSAYQALIKSIRYGLKRYPAIVFNQGEAVIYGLTDLKAALQTYQNWRVSQ